MRRSCLAAVIPLSMLLAGCPEEGRPDAGPSKDLKLTDGPAGEAGKGDSKTPADTGAVDTGPGGDVFVPTDLGFSCKGCLLEEVCVHTVNSLTCQVTKSQCKYRSPACFSPTTNPCCLCEVQVCGLWGTCVRPPGCAAPPAGSYDPRTECFCYSQ
jgi:hypothetical protein